MCTWIRGLGECYPVSSWWKLLLSQVTIRWKHLYYKMNPWSTQLGFANSLTQLCNISWNKKCHSSKTSRQSVSPPYMMKLLFTYNLICDKNRWNILTFPDAKNRHGLGHALYACIASHLRGLQVWRIFALFLNISSSLNIVLREIQWPTSSFLLNTF